MIASTLLMRDCIATTSLANLISLLAVMGSVSLNIINVTDTTTAEMGAMKIAVCFVIQI